MNRLTYAIAEFFINFSDWILPQVISILIALIIFGVLFMLRRKIVTCFLTFIKKLFSRIPHMDEFWTVLPGRWWFWWLQRVDTSRCTFCCNGFGWVAALGFVTTVFRSLVIIMLAWGLLGATSPVITALKAAIRYWIRRLSPSCPILSSTDRLYWRLSWCWDAFDFDITGLITGLGITA